MSFQLLGGTAVSQAFFEFHCFSVKTNMFYEQYNKCKNGEKKYTITHTFKSRLYFLFHGILSYTSLEEESYCGLSGPW